MNDINFTMCKFAGIIAEYDPFHNGHAWQLQQAKALGAQRVAVAMSCGLTQRGQPPQRLKQLHFFSPVDLSIMVCLFITFTLFIMYKFYFKYTILYE